MNVETQPQISSPSRPAYAEASAWLAQLHGPARSAELEADFRSWLGADPQNAQAFEKVTDVWDAIGHVNVGGLPRLSMHEPFEQPPKSWNLSLAAAALVALAVGSAYWFVKDPSYSTGIGEQRIVGLSDGTRVSLNSGTTIAVDFEDAERLIRLEEGEALFEVVQNPRRPFVVLAGDRRITALGTSFVVRRKSDRIDVTLLQGKVTVAASESPVAELDPAKSEAKNAVITLQPGQRFTVLANRTQKLDTPQPEVVTAWRRGEVIFDDTPLNEAIAEMNRYDRTRLVIEDSKIDRLPVSGIYRTGNNQDFAHAVATMYDLSVVADGGKIRLKEK